MFDKKHVLLFISFDKHVCFNNVFDNKSILFDKQLMFVFINLFDKKSCFNHFLWQTVDVFINLCENNIFYTKHID